MIKVAVIGVGSVAFSINLGGDISCYPEFRDATISYMDDDRRRKVAVNRFGGLCVIDEPRA